MNRHHNLYSQMEDALEEDRLLSEDEDYYDEEEYYEEEEYAEYDEEAYAGEENYEEEVEAPPVHEFITPDEDDFCLLDELLFEFTTQWSKLHPLEAPVAEKDVVQYLRANEYNVEGALSFLYAVRVENKKKKGPRILKVVSEKKEETPKPQGEVPQPAEEIVSSEAKKSETVVNAPLKKNANKTRKSVDQLVPDKDKPDCTFVIAGHVDAGKSTTLGHLLLLIGRVDEREVNKNAREAKGTNKESFKYAWLLDQSEEERRRGVTIDSGSFYFETEHRRVHILDAPGHKDYVLSMMSSTTQADAAILIVNAARNEFEVGLANGTKEHLLVLKTFGVGSIIVAINKMDAHDYEESRYLEIVRDLKLLFKQINLSESVIRGFCPISGMAGVNMTSVDRKVMPWYNGPCLVDLLDDCPLESRLLDAPLRLSLQDVDNNKLYVKVESGKLVKGDNLHFLPAEVRVLVKSIEKPTVGRAVDVAFAGDTVEIVTSSDLLGLYPGNVGTEIGIYATPCSTDIEVHLQTFENLQKSILPGSSFIMVLHALQVPVRIKHLISKMNKQGNWSKGMVKCVPPDSQAIVVLHTEEKIAYEAAENCRALGQFILQQDGENVAGGLIKRAA